MEYHRFGNGKYENATRYLRDLISAYIESSHNQKAESRVVVLVARHEARHKHTEPRKIAPLHKNAKRFVTLPYRASRIRVVLDGVDAVEVGVGKPHHLESFIHSQLLVRQCEAGHFLDRD